MSTVSIIANFGSKVSLKRGEIASKMARKYSLSSLSNMKIYTKKGDKGYSYNFLGERQQKDDEIFEALGATDELSSAIGLASEFCADEGHEVLKDLQEIQCILQDVGANVATPNSSVDKEKTGKMRFQLGEVERLEKWIDQYHSRLPKLTKFVLPSGGKASASLHLARTVCRRAERRITPLVRAKNVDDEVLRYMNRLSDYLFTAARYACYLEGKEERTYERKPRS